MRELIDQVAAAGFNVIVCGETGVGKELVVTQPLPEVEPAGEALRQGELRGPARHPAGKRDVRLRAAGPSPAPSQHRRGKFEQADGGVLFLDEIGDMSLPLQSKLLHVLQGGDFTPLGSEKQVQTDVWVIAATNRDLETGGRSAATSGTTSTTG
ncbi:MAG: sigma-54 factor interaction domain-containing protein [Desulfosudis oleivorans]|nr:sigma-54 factor interaction domain-containing protein [Desulfosudis oleivorans]